MLHDKAEKIAALMQLIKASKTSKSSRLPASPI